MASHAALGGVQSPARGGAPICAAARGLRPRRCGRRAPAGVHALFTGIVQGQATVAAVERRPESCSLDVRFPAGALAGVAVGASVALNGTCLTVVAADAAAGAARFDVVAETLRRTNLGALAAGGAVNFERAARVGDEIGGHTVSGHVHTTARLVAVEASAENRRLEFRLDDPAWMKYILPKGFVAVDGCSLTVGEVSGAGFSVYLIPETLRVTVLGARREGDTVNVEVEAQTQAIVDTVERVLAARLAGGGAGGAATAV